MPLFRSMLFAPGNHARKVEKCLQVHADAVILDLEDAVAIAEKEATRSVVVAALQQPRQCLGYIRVNAIDTPYCYGDVQAAVVPGVDGIVLPKLESASDLRTIDWLVTQLERERGLEAGAVDIVPIIETARGIAQIEAICEAGTRMRRLTFGAGDYTLDMGLMWTAGERELGYARAKIAQACRAARIEAPIDTVHINLGRMEELRGATELAKSMGFQGKMCIHPEQVAPVNEIFSPTDEQVALAKRYVQAFEEAEAAGSASIQVDGYFLDYPIVAKAQRVLEQAEAIDASGRSHDTA
ncbi:MAG: citrate lyase subunit beta/citryl-CoA lyase [Gammaproteobacteria bacterium]|jgi:citrate lyase subunit beta/citryl-CoA lyase